MSTLSARPKGGRLTPAEAGIKTTHRDILWGMLTALPEGSIFRPKAFTEGLEAGALEDLLATTGYDHLHLSDGWHTPVRETAHVRIAPDPIKVVDTWCAHHQWGTPYLFGDWLAHKHGLYPWEPLAGFRFRVPAPKVDCVLALGHMRIRIQEGPSWLMDNSPQGELLRALTDMPHKTLRINLRQWLPTAPQNRAHLDQVLETLDALDEEWRDCEAAGKGERPSVVAGLVRSALG